MAPEQRNKVGGLTFFAGLLLALYLAVMNTRFIIKALLPEAEKSNILYLAAGLITGALIASFVIRKDMAVFAHEFKHWILAVIVGNKVKKMKFRNFTGHVEFEYYKHTAHYNSFIMLAPYWFPLATIAGLFLIIGIHLSNPPLAIFFLGTFFGIDIWHAMTDLGPHQTDLINLRGGYPVGVLFIVAMNLLTFTLILTWAFAATKGFLLMMNYHWHIISAIFGISV